MEPGRICTLLSVLTLFAAASWSASAAAEEVGDDTVVPELETRQVRLADIDTEDFEIGVTGGLMTVEDFESSAVTALNLKYHVTEDFFVEARYGRSKLGLSSYERLSGGATLIADEDRTLQFYDLSLGVNLFPGETFIANRWAVNSAFYLTGGVGATDFAGNQALTITAGVGYRLIASDFIALDVGFRDHLFDTEITGEKKLTHNTELSAGISFFF